MMGFSRQHGSILVVSTIMLAVLAGLSISTLQNVVLQYKLSSQTQDQAIARAAAQYALAEGKRLLLTNWATGSQTCSAVQSCTAVNGVSVWSSSAFSGSSDLSQQPATFFNAAQATSASPMPNLTNPRFFVIDLGCDAVSNAERYRIVAKGFGFLPNTVAYAESTLTVPLTGQNAYAATTYTVTGLQNGTSVWTKNMSYSTSTKSLFFTTSNNSCGTQPVGGQSGLSTGATCEMNCAGQVRVKGYSFYTSGANCPWIYGDWMGGGQTSQISLKNSSGTAVTLGCRGGFGPCSQTISCCVAKGGTAASCGATNCVVGSCPACSQSASCCVANGNTDATCSATTCIAGSFPACSSSVNSNINTNCCTDPLGATCTSATNSATNSCVISTGGCGSFTPSK